MFSGNQGIFFKNSVVPQGVDYGTWELGSPRVNCKVPVTGVVLVRPMCTGSSPGGSCGTKPSGWGNGPWLIQTDGEYRSVQMKRRQARAATPPMTPPTMAPTLGAGVGLGVADLM